MAEQRVLPTDPRLLFIGTILWLTAFLGILIVFCTNAIVKRLDHNAALADLRATRQTQQLSQAVSLEATMQQIEQLKNEAVINQNTNMQLRAMITVQRQLLRKASIPTVPE